MKSKIEKLLIKCRPIPDFPGYLITECGILISTRRGKYEIKKWQKSRKGYLVGSGWYTNKNFKIQQHRAVLSSFKPTNNWRNLHVDHINGIRTDNKLSNLRWVTPKQNAYATIQREANNYKLSDKQVNDALLALKYDSAANVSKHYGISKRYLNQLKSGDYIRKSSYKKIKKPIPKYKAREESGVV